MAANFGKTIKPNKSNIIYILYKIICRKNTLKIKMKLIDVNIKLEAEKMIIYYFLIDCERPGASRLATSDVSNMNDLGVVV